MCFSPEPSCTSIPGLPRGRCGPGPEEEIPANPGTWGSFSLSLLCLLQSPCFYLTTTEEGKLASPGLGPRLTNNLKRYKRSLKSGWSLMCVGDLCSGQVTGEQWVLPVRTLCSRLPLGTRRDRKTSANGSERLKSRDSVGRLHPACLEPWDPAGRTPRPAQAAC